MLSGWTSGMDGISATYMACPNCGDAMLATYKQVPRTDLWRWVWTCQTCGREIPITDAH